MEHSILSVLWDIRNMLGSVVSGKPVDNPAPEFKKMFPEHFKALGMDRDEDDGIKEVSIL